LQFFIPRKGSIVFVLRLFFFGERTKFPYNLLHIMLQPQMRTEEYGTINLDTKAEGGRGEQKGLRTEPGNSELETWNCLTVNLYWHP
jgi:hypothetical protein